MDSDLEDSVSLGTVEEEVVTQPTSRRRLQRLQKLDDAPPTQSAPAEPAAGWDDQNPDYWDEEDEYADQLHKGDKQEDDQDSEGAKGSSYHASVQQPSDLTQSTTTR